MSAAGTWVNEYGSIMTLVGEGTTFSGVYQSSTGSVGTYEVLGVQVGSAARDTLGQPLAFAISWRAVDDAPPDPSWHWSSGLCGQISIQDGQEVLVVAHTMVASSDFPGLAKAGSYIDKLTYKRVAARVLEPSEHRKIEVPGNPLAGRWSAVDGTTLELKVHTAFGSNLGYVSGNIVLQTGTLHVAGFTDLQAASLSMRVQSVALTAAIGTSQALALAGTLDVLTGSLSLLEMTSESTAPGNSYSQTRVASTLYSRYDACKAACDCTSETSQLVRNHLPGHKNELLRRYSSVEDSRLIGNVM